MGAVEVYLLKKMAWKNYSAMNSWQQEAAVKESKINAAFFKVERLHDLWKEAHRLWRSGDLQMLSYQLDSIWFELVADGTYEQKKTYEKHRLDTAWYYSKAKSAKSVQERRFYENKGNEMIREIWSFLTFVENFQGLGKAYKEVRDDDIF